MGSCDAVELCADTEQDADAVQLVASQLDLTTAASLQGTCALPALQDPHGYRASTFDWLDPRSPVQLDRWITVFEHSVPTFMRHAEDSSPGTGKAQAFAAAFAACCAAVKQVPGAWHTNVGALARQDEPQRLCALRELCLAAVGLGDIFAAVKDRENKLALQLLPGLLSELDGIAVDIDRWECLIRGVFAGNVFDLGAAASSQLHERSKASFHSTREKLRPRPWVVDDMGPALRALADTSRYTAKVVLLVDNSGSDVVLGMLPFAREFLRSRPEVQVVVGANELPSINDITAAELRDLLDAAKDLLGPGDPLIKAWADGRLKLVSTGNGLPVIDLTKVSQELVDAADGCELLVLEGMGRAIETNLHAKFSCDSLKLGMVKHPEVADMLGGTLFDCVCKFDKV